MMRYLMRAPRALVGVLAALSVSLLVATGCGSSSSSSSSSSSGSATTTSTSASQSASGTASASGGGTLVQAAQAEVAKLVAPAALSTTKQAAFKPPSGKTIGILDCGDASPDCSETTHAAQQAVATLGWKSIVKQNGLSVPGWATSMQELVQAHPDGIISIVASDSEMPNAMKEAAAAKIPVVGLIAGNTFVAPVQYPAKGNVDPDYSLQGKVAADYIIAQSNGTAKVLELTDPSAVANVARAKAFEAELAKCSGCKLVGKYIFNASLEQAQAGQAAAGAALAAHPAGSVNWIESNGSVRDPGVLLAVKQAGRQSNVQVISIDCKASSLLSIDTNGPLKACVTTPLLRGGWAAVDTIARILAGQNPGQVYVPFSLVTKANAPSAAVVNQRNRTLQDQVFTEPDYVSYYKTLWGVK
jgi:ribose transport system substrate-binding protein